MLRLSAILSLLLIAAHYAITRSAWQAVVLAAAALALHAWLGPRLQAFEVGLGAWTPSPAFGGPVKRAPILRPINTPPRASHAPNPTQKDRITGTGAGNFTERVERLREAAERALAGAPPEQVAIVTRLGKDE
jgi:hypothetical protein